MFKITVEFSDMIDCIDRKYFNSNFYGYIIRHH